MYDFVQDLRIFVRYPPLSSTPERRLSRPSRSELLHSPPLRRTKYGIGERISINTPGLGRGGPSGARWLVLNLAVNLLHSTRPAATPIQPEGWVGPPSPGGPRRVPGTGGLLDWPAACWLSRACLRMAWRGLLAGRRSGAERSSPRLCRAHAELLTRGVGPRTRTEHCMPAWFASGFAHSVTDANRP